MDITFNVKKIAVYDEVAKTTSYVGVKRMSEDENNYERVFTTEDDRDMLERFWREASISVTDELKQFIVSVSSLDNNQVVDDKEVYTVSMSMPSSFDEILKPSIELSLMSFFVNSIIFKWFAISAREDAEYYKKATLESMNEVRKKIFFRKKPNRVVPTD